MAARADEPLPEADRFEACPHPRETLDLVGHAEAEHALLEAYRGGCLPQAFILGGPQGIGKATLAWRLARFLFAYPDPQAPLVRAARDLSVPADHPVARRLAGLALADLVVLRREWNDKTKKLYTEIRAEDVRRVVHLFQRAASAGGYRICILDSAEDLNREGANALLKLIEEPPPRSLFLIVAHRPALVLPTIRSRSRAVALRPLEEAQILRVVETFGPPWNEAEPADKMAAAARARGSVQEALRLLNGRGLALDAELQALLGRLPHVDWLAVHGLADQIAGRDALSDYDMVLTAIFDWLDLRVRQGAKASAGATARRLAPYAEVWEKVAEAARETEALNLDKRPLILSIFADLAAAAEAASP